MTNILKILLYGCKKLKFYILHFKKLEKNYSKMKYLYKRQFSENKLNHKISYERSTSLI